MVIIGIGDRTRGDDAAGLLVARLVRARAPAGIEVLERGGEAAALLEAWRGAGAVLVADAIRSGSRPGSIHRIDARRRPLPWQTGVSSHGFGLAAAIELARVLGELPPALVVYGIEGGRFQRGASLSPEVEAAAPVLASRMLRDAIGLRTTSTEQGA